MKMNKKIVVLLIITILSLGMFGCAQPADEGPLPDDGTPTEGSQSPADDDGIEPAEPDTDEPANSEEVKTDTGRFLGQADNNFIEIKISGVPDDMDPTVFMLSEEVKESFSALGLDTDDEIKFEYYINEHDQKVITNISRI